MARITRAQVYSNNTNNIVKTSDKNTHLPKKLNFSDFSSSFFLIHCTITLDPDLGPDLVPCPRDSTTVTVETEVETTMATDEDSKGVQDK